MEELTKLTLETKNADGGSRSRILVVPKKRKITVIRTTSDKILITPSDYVYCRLKRSGFQSLRPPSRKKKKRKVMVVLMFRNPVLVNGTRIA